MKDLTGSARLGPHGWVDLARLFRLDQSIKVSSVKISPIYSHPFTDVHLSGHDQVLQAKLSLTVGVGDRVLV